MIKIIVVKGGRYTMDIISISIEAKLSNNRKINICSALLMFMEMESQSIDG